MSITRINDNLPITSKISTLSEQILEIFGLVEKARFDENEVTQIIADSGMDRKYLRNQSLGHTLATYTGWTHLHAESGYSIWKYSPTNYKYNSVNELYLDDTQLENRGEANSESYTTFNYVYLDAGSLFIDNTTEAGTEDGTSFDLMNDTSDYLYVGLSTTFAGISFEFDTRGSNYTNEIEYWNGVAWTTLDISGNTFSDDTSDFESDGRIYWSIPSNWAETTVNSVSKYWVRISTSTTPVTAATAYIITPANSVISLLKLSSAEVLDEDWAWCSYGTSIYVTIRNAGQSAYEGKYYITSSSTSINKQNYFIHNHEFTADYEDSTYIQTDMVTNLDDLSNVMVSSGLLDGQVLLWDSGDSLWINKSLTLDNLSDVMVSSGLIDGQVLSWDAGDNIWRNTTPSEGVTNHALLSNLDYASSGHTGFQPAGSYLTDLSGLDTDDLSEGAINKYDETVVLTEGTNITITGTYPNFTINATSGVTTLDSLSDVMVSSGLVNGQVLTWDSGDAIWRNQTPASGVTSHPLLTELDYASAGHTGFQASLINSAGLSTAIGGDVAVVDGGTGKSSWTQYLLVYADTTTSLSQIAIGTSGQVLTSNGAGSAPTFQNSQGGASSLDQLTDVVVNSGITDKDLLSWDNGDAVWRNRTSTELGLLTTVTGAKTYTTTFTNDDFISALDVIDFFHNLGKQYVNFIITDNNGEWVLPDDVDFIDDNELEVDLHSQYPITGTWNIRITG